MGGWVYIMANRYRGAMYVGMTADLATRVHQHRTGSGSEHCRQLGLDRLVWAEHVDDITAAIAHEKRVKRWLRAWKFELIERGIPTGGTCPGVLAEEAWPRVKPGAT